MGDCRRAYTGSSSWAGNNGDQPEEKDRDDVEGDEDDDTVAAGFVPGPLVPLKEQLERDKDDESLRRWKEKLLGCVEGELNDQIEPEVTFHSIVLLSEGCTAVIKSSELSENRGGVIFALKEGSSYRLKLLFSVRHNIVSGLAYSNTVWKGVLPVDETKEMLGTFAPQREPYIHLLDEETTPSGVLARGIYSAKLKFVDDDNRCHLELNYQFEIKSR